MRAKITTFTQPCVLIVVSLNSPFKGQLIEMFEFFMTNINSRAFNMTPQCFYNDELQPEHGK